MKKKRGK